ncbi:flagellar hook capping FlgD N-terminal domain-containing protein [Campylobacter sp. RM12647]|uniref:flagellar hook capping FlgD N-terminal domain-containing protein n=1 Tax=Campylobacter sp. RM12647 TaxID=2735737 RepID=UPI001D62BB1A|nr:hypothetical protein [Campylobacter sp. RM12647]
MAISPMNNTAMSVNTSIAAQNANTLSDKQKSEGFSLDNTIHTSDVKKQEADAKALKEADGTNPNSKISQEAFMRLLLEELKHQDPTSPMDSDKMLTQTSQLAALETQEKTNKTMDELAKRMELLSNSVGIGMINAVGKMAVLKKDAFTHDGKAVDLPFNLYFPNGAPNDVVIGVFNSNKEQIDAIKVDKDIIQKGNNNFIWDTRYEDGTIREKGDFKFVAQYEDEHGNIVQIPSGYFKVDGVTFEDGKAYLNASGIKISFDDIAQFQDEKL